MAIIVCLISFDDINQCLDVTYFRFLSVLVHNKVLKDLFF